MAVSRYPCSLFVGLQATIMLAKNLNNSTEFREISSVIQPGSADQTVIICRIYIEERLLKVVVHLCFEITTADRNNTSGLIEPETDHRLQ